MKKNEEVKPTKNIKDEAKHASTLLFVVDILKKYSSAEHPLNAKAILEIMQEYPYEHTVSERTIERMLNLLRSFYIPEFRICIAQKIERNRTNKKSGKTVKADIYTGYYYEPILSDVEYRLLIDSILFSRFITADQVKEISEKIVPLANQKFKNYTPIVRKTTSKFFKPKEDYIEHIEILSKAISKKLLVKMVYGEYAFNNKLMNPEDSEPREFNAHSLILKNGEYYVLGHWINESVHEHKPYRVSRIKSVEITEDSRFPNEYHSYSAGEYIANHPKMQEGCPRHIVLRVKEDRADLIVENFGNEYKVYWKDIDEFPDYDGYVEVRLTANPEDVYRVALENADAMEVISPQDLRHKISDIGASLQFRYGLTDDDKYYDAITPTTVNHRKFQTTGDVKKDKIRERIYEHYSPYSNKVLHLYGINLNRRSEHHKLTEIETLRIGENNIQDYSFIANYKKLRRLIWAGPLPKDLSWMKELSELSTFVIESSHARPCPNIVIPDFSFLNECKNMFHIAIRASHATFENPTSLLNLDLPKLKSIDFSIKEARDILGEELIAQFKEKFPNVDLYILREKM